MAEFPSQQLREIEQLGFSILEHTKPWRFVRGTTLKDGKTYFFKISPPDNPSLSANLERQASFDQVIGKIIEESESKPPFRTPQVLQTYFAPTSSFVIFEYFPGSLVAEWVPMSNPKDLVTWLPKIVDSLLFLDSIDPNTVKLLNDQPLAKPLNREMVDFMQSWAEKPLHTGLLKPTELEGAMSLVPAALLPNRLQHGDFVPWHMIELAGGNIGLIDSEHASIHRPRFYDSAYFYHRVFTKLCQPGIAREFLKTFMQRSRVDPVVLQEQFLPVLAQRVIGGMLDYTERDHEFDDQTKTMRDLHRELIILVLSQDLTKL